MIAPRFGTNASKLPAPVDLAIPTILQGHDIFEPSSSTKDLLTIGTVFGVGKLSQGAAQSLRAASILALDEIVVRADALGSDEGKGWFKTITAAGLFAWIKAVQPDPDEVANVLTDTDSVFY